MEVPTLKRLAYWLITKSTLYYLWSWRFKLWNL